MSDTNSNRPIDPEAVAAKLAAVRNYEHPEVLGEIESEPRLVEVLLFLEWVSQPANYAGGLRRFAADLIATCGDMIGTREMLEIECGLKLTDAQKRKIYSALPGTAKSTLGGQDDDYHLAEIIGLSIDNDPEVEVIENWSDDVAGEGTIRYPRRERWFAREAARLTSESQLETLLAKAEWQTFHELCTKEAGEKLSAFLRTLCELPHARFRRPASEDDGTAWQQPDRAPWYFCDVSEAILSFIDHRKAELAKTIAETEVTRTVFKWLGKARNTSRGVMISGNSRFGKTEALRLWCAMNPGVARLVNTPASNSESDLLREVAKTLGLETGPHSGGSQLRERIDYVLRNTRLMLVWDESQFLYPSNFSRNTAPARLNWVRRSVMDAGLPCAFCATPQSYNSAKKRFVKTTGYAIEQFEERLLKTVELPNELSREDLLAVARIHFPDLADAFLQFVVGKVAATERNFLSDIEKIAALARDNGQEAGRKKPTLDDIKSAIADVLPRAQSGSEQAKPVAENAPLPERCTAPATAVHSPRQPAAGSRSPSPLGRINFSSETPEESALTTGHSAEPHPNFSRAA